MSVIQTVYGPVVGFDDTFPTVRSHPCTNGQPNGGEAPLSKWLGIRYAQAGRWQRPRPPTPWNAPLQCIEFGPRFPQVLNIIDLIFSRKEGFNQNRPSLLESEEHGFNLNVFAPAGFQAAQELPVLVWIYGGSLEGGSSDSAIYDPTEWIRRESREGRNFIVVSGNYRCGIFGFMACQDLVEDDAEDLAGNYGAYDCIAMLQWVQDNIRNFGGNPDNVTIFGESAGAFLVGALLVTQNKLFKQAILQSGAPETLTHRSVYSSANQQYFENLLQYFSIPHDLSSEQRIRLLREIPTSKIMEFVSSRGAVINDYGLTIEESAKSAIWNKPAIDLIMERKWNPHLKSLMMGHTKDEGSIFAFFFQTTTKEGYANVLRKRCPFSPQTKIDKLYPPPEALETHKPLAMDWKNCAGSRLIADQLCESPMENLAMAFDDVKHHSTGEQCKVFFYQLNEKLPSIDPGLDWGAFHTIDLPLIFNIKTLWDSDSDQAKTSAVLGRMWADFAQTGCPDAIWPEYAPSTSPKKLFIDHGGKVSIDDVERARTELQKRRIQFWIDQLPHMVKLQETVC
ncbi:hypothetical protein MJO28_007627 [Puccinia striiformis f. sp. tritici]|uniref:Carboxylic ester hydrolase n=2 Tax=Puccinia striiformis f. sp. tritici TaxID=168172 RepID=A0A0L0UY98_9BASI|nr:hypothetical protein Pst134EB_014699 [Puccinia striiformis f. sp. tritici]KAI7951943.1 hypothetical protein MJO28_007627 [Puccinia striiformis f. sp. tritici]KNE92017.1 hypothetical protein PSTG_14550 [Puccinia striiformis f. sp. tritici PST-78]